MSRPPDDLCQSHRDSWRDWHRHVYNPREPRDWPGQHIADSRTSHEQRRRWWDEKNDEQKQLIERICRSGWSLQCTPGHHPPHLCAGCGQQVGQDTGGRNGPRYFTRSPDDRNVVYACPAGDHHYLTTQPTEES